MARSDGRLVASGAPHAGQKKIAVEPSGPGVGRLQERWDYLENIYYLGTSRAYVGSSLQTVYKYRRTVQRRRTFPVAGGWSDVGNRGWPKKDVISSLTNLDNFTLLPEEFTTTRSPAQYGSQQGGDNSGDRNPGSANNGAGTGNGSIGRAGSDEKGKGGGGGASASTLGSIAKKPYGFNPPLHNFTLAHKPPFEKHYTNTKRLGIIYTPDMVVNSARYSKRWGFRFQYNPTYWGYGVSTSSNTTPEQIDNSVANVKMMEDGTQQWVLELLLNRMIDLRIDKPSTKHYSPNITAPTLAEIRKRGTEYDLDYLYRVINGDPQNITAGGRTFQSANPGWLIMQRVGVKLADGAAFFGWVTGINVKHVMMTPNLVPTITQVTLNIQEHKQQGSAIKKGKIR